MVTYLFLAGIIVIGLISSYTDIRYGKIKNSLLLFGMLYAVVVHAIVYFTADVINPVAYIHYATNAVFALFLGFLLWFTGLWTAGDAKLFFVLNLLTPTDFIQVGYTGYVYGFVYFTNVFGLLFLYFLFIIFKKVPLCKFIFACKQTFRLKHLLPILLFIFSFSIVFRFMPPIFRINFFMAITLFFVCFIILRKLFGKFFMPFILVLGIIRIIVDHAQMANLGFWKDFFLQVFTFILLRLVILRLSYYAFTKKMPLADLKEGVFLAEDIIPMNSITKTDEHPEGQKATVYRKRPLRNLTFFSYLERKKQTCFAYDMNLGLSQENLDWFRKHEPQILFRNVRVYETMYFAPFIFGGVLLTLLVKGDFFIVAAKWIIGWFA